MTVLNPDPTDRIYSRLIPIAYGDEEAGYPLYGLIESLTLPQMPLEEIVREDDTHPAWTRAVDPFEAPLWVLPWLATLMGVEWHGDSTDLLRAKIIERPRYRRGTVPAIRSAVSETLTGTKTVRVVTRGDGTPWSLMVLTSPSETPNSAATLAAFLTEKPAGVITSFFVDDRPYIDEGTNQINAVAATIDAATLADVT